MSFPFDLLYEVAEVHKPKVPIKDKAIWVAVLSHTKLNIDEITQENDFMWVKCHDRITVKTIKHHYFTRFPLNKFELKHRDRYPRLESTVGLLRTRDKRDSNLVVLRALEPEDAAHEDRLRDDRAIARIIRDETAKLEVSKTQAPMTIVLDDDDEITSSEPEKSISKAKSEMTAEFDIDHFDNMLREYCEGDDRLSCMKNNRRRPIGTLENSDKRSENNKKSKSKPKQAFHNKSNSPILLSSSPTPQTETLPCTNPEPLQLPPPSTHEFNQRLREISKPITKLINETCDPAPFEPETTHHQKPRRRLKNMYDASMTNEAILANLRAAVEPENVLKTCAVIDAANHDPEPTYSDNEVDLYSMLYFPDVAMGSDPARHDPTDGFLRLFDELPEPERSEIKAKTLHFCEVPSCQKEIELKPWTIFGPRKLPLCTRCACIRLEKYPLNLGEFNAKVAEERRLKQEMETVHGIPQDADDDASVRMPLSTSPSHQRAASPWDIGFSTPPPRRAYDPDHMNDFPYSIANTSDIDRRSPTKNSAEASSSEFHSSSSSHPSYHDIDRSLRFPKGNMFSGLMAEDAENYTLDPTHLSTIMADNNEDYNDNDSQYNIGSTRFWGSATPHSGGADTEVVSDFADGSDDVEMGDEDGRGDESGDEDGGSEGDEAMRRVLERNERAEEMDADYEDDG